ncbi:hypothetical protein P3T29_005940, partial [Kitasatospora sp. MAP5-34]|nr:hypothetical protein [Kitasatospora sp. MAP5-34]
MGRHSHHKPSRWTALNQWAIANLNVQVTGLVWAGGGVLGLVGDVIASR